MGNNKLARVERPPLGISLTEADSAADVRGTLLRKDSMRKMNTSAQGSTEEMRNPEKEILIEKTPLGNLGNLLHKSQ